MGQGGGGIIGGEVIGILTAQLFANPYGQAREQLFSAVDSDHCKTIQQAGIGRNRLISPPIPGYE